MRLGKALRGLVRSVSGCVGKLLLPRVERCRCWVVGRPELAGVEPAAVAGARDRAAQRYGAGEDKLVAALACCGAAEHVAVLGNELARQSPRLRHGRRREALDRDGIGVRGRKRARGEGETTQELTASAAVASASSRRHQSKRSIEGDLRRPVIETKTVASFQASRECVAQ